MKTLEEALKVVIPKRVDQCEEFREKYSRAVEVQNDPTLKKEVLYAAALCVSTTPEALDADMIIHHVADYLITFINFGIAIGIEMERQEWPSLVE